jgi:hypothetical protein
MTQDVVVGSFGGGTNSEAMYLGMLDRNEPAPYAILFADTGGEKPKTYKNLHLFSEYLVRRGYPAITILHRSRRDKQWKSLEDDCLRLGTLPSVAYGWKTCSQKFKIEPQNKWCNNNPVLREVWGRGELVTKLIGYDFGEPQRARFGVVDGKYRMRYPLIEWEWGRPECEVEILKHRLPLPGKSSCFFCPHMRKAEILDLASEYPDLMQRALEIERRGLVGAKKVKGLGRTFSWENFLHTKTAPADDPHDEKPCGCFE